MNNNLAGIALEIDKRQRTNSLQEILGGLVILWSAVKKRLLKDPVAVDWMKTQTRQECHLFGSLQDLGKDDIRRLVAMDPRR